MLHALGVMGPGEVAPVGSSARSAERGGSGGLCPPEPTIKIELTVRGDSLAPTHGTATRRQLTYQGE